MPLTKGDNRPSWFKMFLHQKSIVDSVDDATAGKALKALFQYFATGEDVQLDQLSFVVFSAFKPCVDASFEEFRKLSEAGKAGNKKRWGESKSGGDTTRHYPITPNPEDRRQKIEERGQKTDDRVCIADKPPAHSSFTPPTVDEVRAYCNENNYTFNPEYFESYYRSRGWMLGNAPMQDWKAVADSWQQKEKKEKPINKRDEMPDFWKVPVI